MSRRWRMYGRFASVVLAACGGGFPGLPGTNASPLSIKVTAKEDPTTTLAGAIGYAEYADGTDELVTTDDNGVLSFVSSGLAAGLSSISVGAPGRVVRSIVAPDVWTYEQTGIPLTLYDETPQPTATLSGKLKNAAHANDVVFLGATLYSSAGELQTTSAYSLVLPQNQPFTIVGVDFSSLGGTGRDTTADVAKWFHIDFDALTGDQSFDIDVSAQPADSPTTVSNKLVVPDPNGAFGSSCSAVVDVYTLDPNRMELTALVGTARIVSLASDKKSFAFEEDYITSLGGPLVTWAGLESPDGSYSYRLAEGPPSADLPIDGLRVPLKLSSNVVSAGDDVDVSDAIDPVWFSVATGTAGKVWSVKLDSGSQLRIPVLPDELKALFAEPGPYQGTVETCVQVPASDPTLGGFCSFGTVSAPAVAEP